MVVGVILVWRKDKERDRTALHAIPMCPPHQNCRVSLRCQVGFNKVVPGTYGFKCLLEKYLGKALRPCLVRSSGRAQLGVELASRSAQREHRRRRTVRAYVRDLPRRGLGRSRPQPRRSRLSRRNKRCTRPTQKSKWNLCWIRKFKKSSERGNARMLGIFKGESGRSGERVAVGILENPPVI